MERMNIMEPISAEEDQKKLLERLGNLKCI